MFPVIFVFYAVLKYLLLLKKILIHAAIALALLIATAGTLVYLYQEKIIAFFIEEANKHINTPVSVQKFDVSLFEKFPQISIVLDSVYIQEGLKGSSYPLARAQRVYCTFKLMDFIIGEYAINEIHLEDAEIFLKVDRFGKNNYTIIQAGNAQEKGPVSFNLDKIKLKNVSVNYIDEKRKQSYTFFAQDMAAQLNISGPVYDIGLEGEMRSDRIQVEENSYFQNKQMHLKTQLVYNESTEKLVINPSQVFINQSSFLVEGSFTNLDKDYIDISVQGENTDVQTILSLFPENIYEKYKVYTSKGDVYFNGAIKGSFSNSESPELHVNFGCKNASFQHPEYKKSIDHVSMEGSFHSSQIEDLSTAHLQLNGVEGTLEGKKFSGGLSLKDFDDYHLNAHFKGEVNVGSLLQFFPVESVRSAQGIADLDIRVNGRLNDLKDVGTTDKVATSGEILLKDLRFSLTNSQLPYNNLNGSFIFNNNDLAISAFSGEIGNSKFLLNGFFKNIISFLAFKDQPISIEADLQSSFIDLDELLSADVDENASVSAVKNANSTTDQEYSFTISPKITLAFNCDVEKVKLRRFRGRNLKGQLKVENQKMLAKNITVNAAGGKMELEAGVDARQKDYIEVSTFSSFNNIAIDSIFYIFENFNQDFLVDEHLKGQIFADMNNYLVFDSKLRLNTAKMVTDLEISIKNGELNNFEPIQQLSKYVEEQSLAHMRFSDLKNSIHIEDKTIYLPEMEINSNVTTISVKGTHTFDQRIDYQLKVPLRRMDRKDKDEAFGAIEDDGLGNAKLFLTIKGTTDDYAIGYDTQAVKNKIREDIKKEGQELKDAFKNKGKGEDKVKELSEDEYFDF